MDSQKPVHNAEKEKPKENGNEKAQANDKAPEKKTKKSGVWRRYGYYIFFIAVFLMFELVLRLATVKRFGFSGFLYSAGFNVILSFLVCYALTFASKKTRVAVNNAVLIIAAVLYISQIIYYGVFGTYYNTESMMNAGQIVQFWPTILKTAWARLFYILLCALPIPAYNLYVRRTTVASPEKKIKKLPRMEAYRLRRRRRINLCASIAVYVIVIIAIVPFASDPTAAYSKYFGQDSYEESIKRAGLLSTLHVDLLKVFINEDASGSLIDSDGHGGDLFIDYYTASPSAEAGGGEETDPPNGEGTAGPSGEEASVPPPPPKEYGYNMMDIDFDALYASEKNNAVKGLHEYFAYQRPSQKNEYTGMFEGYNLLMFCAEAFSPFAVDPELTPTLYKLVNEGFHFTDFYTPIWWVSTSDGEYVACTGLIPRSSGGWSFRGSATNYLPFVMGNQLKSLGYKTNAYHDHTYTYYGRDLSHPNMGYTYKGVGNGLTLPKIRWPNSDLEMMEATIDEYIYNQPFHAYYMTVSGHLEYNFPGNAMASRNRAAVANLPYSDACKAYIACNIELDKALAYTLERLNAAGIAEKTLIVLSADHYPYGLKKEGETFDGISEMLGHKVDEVFEMHKNNLIIYAQGMEPVTVDKPCSSLDIIPTISNLLGLEFDSRLLMGRDILSNSDALVIFKDRSFITDKGYYIKGKEFVPNPGVTVDDDYARLISSAIDAKFTASTRILENDYYRKVFG